MLDPNKVTHRLNFQSNAMETTLDEPEWHSVSDQAKDLVSKLLTYDPAKRISALDALNHPWIQETASIDRVSKHITENTLKNLQNFRVSDRS